MAKSATIGGAMRTRKGLGIGLVLVAILVAIAAILVGTKPAGAAFPGNNGKIVFYSDQSIVGGDPSITDTEIFSMNVNGTSPQNVTMSTANGSDPDWQPAG
jgi:hypothetical protein